MADGVFIGPYDLSLALGFPPPSPDPHPEVEKVIQQILASAHAKGKKWCAQICPLAFSRSPLRLRFSGFFCTSGTQVPRRVKEGFDMVHLSLVISTYTPDEHPARRST